MIYHVFLAVAALFALSACNPVENLETGEKKIAQYERAYSAGDAEALWTLPGDQFRGAISREEFDNLLAVFNARLGPIVSSERANFNVSVNNGMSQTVVVMDTEFEQGAGTQVYTFFGNGDEMELVGWNVNSPRLAITAADLKASDSDPEAELQTEN